jgi:hypothetical protein
LICIGDITYDLHQIALAYNGEGHMAKGKLVCDDPQPPDVRLGVVLLSLEDLGANIEGGSAEGGPTITAGIGSPSEVA